MALIKCPECENEISNRAASCPNCGMPMRQVASTSAPVSHQNEDLLHCPKCKSTNLHIDKKGFSGGKALAGAVVAGGIGILAGTIGSRDIDVTCLKCGHKFNPAKDLKKKQQAEQRARELNQYKEGEADTVLISTMLICWLVAFVFLFISGIPFVWSLVLFCIGCFCPALARLFPRKR